MNPNPIISEDDFRRFYPTEIEVVPILLFEGMSTPEPMKIYSRPGIFKSLRFYAAHLNFSDRFFGCYQVQWGKGFFGAPVKVYGTISVVAGKERTRMDLFPVHLREIDTLSKAVKLNFDVSPNMTR